MCAFIAVVGATLAACAAAPQVTPPKPQRPWSNLDAPTFQDLLASYGAANLPTKRDEVLDRYLRSQTETFDRYVAAREVGIGVKPLQLEALKEIQNRSAMLPSKRFVARFKVAVEPYDTQLGGFPIYELPMDVNAVLRIANSDVRTHVAAEGRARGYSIISDGYGFVTAYIGLSKLGWYVPVSRDQAVQVLQNASRDGDSRKITIAVIYSVERCDAASNDASALACDSKVNSIYVIDPSDADAAPIAQLSNAG